MRSLLPLLYFCFCFLSTFSIYPAEKVILDEKWSVMITKGPPQANPYLNKAFTSTVPSTIHLILEDQQLIPNPFFRNNLADMAWISDCTVSYSISFLISEEQLKRDNIELVLEGVDTYSSVLVNKVVVGTTINAFLEYRFSIKEHLKLGLNSLEVLISPTRIFDEQGQAKDRMPFPYAQTRKACYQYSWDWAPYMNTLGLWKQVYLFFFNDLRIDYVEVQLEQLTKQSAILNFAVVLNSPARSIQDGYAIVITETSLPALRVEKQITAKPDQYLKLTIPDPKLWWPNGIGNPNIYEFIVQLKLSGTIIDSKPIVYGIKLVTLDETNNKFTISINGYPVYCKGANYVPPDMQYPRITNPHFKSGNNYKKLLSDAVESNYNMIRVWGGGQYQSDEFYEIASRKGIMIFHDFMFSDSVYPSSAAFLQNVRNQVIFQIRRIRNYPSLTLWSGNNEILQGIQAWGWGSQKYRTDYRHLFEELIRELTTAQTPNIPYIASSPSKGVGNFGFERGGDVHYWGVWAGGAPFQSYKSSVGAFNSEFGTQALPVWETVVQFTEKDDRSYESNVLLFHEKHNSRFSMISNYMAMYSKKPLNFELEVYQSGLVQAFGIQIAIIAQRVSKPKSFGTLYWQMNDAWPGISWSSIDYYGRWKPLQYMAKRLYSPVVIMIEDDTKVTVFSDLLFDVEVFASVELFLLNGQSVRKQFSLINVKANSKTLMLELSRMTEAQAASTCMYAEVVYGKEQHQVAYTSNFFAHFQRLQLIATTLTVSYSTERNSITVSTLGVIKNLHIYNSKQYIRFSDNYFDLFPSHPRVVTLLDGATLSDLRATMKFRSYMQVYTPGELNIQE